MQTKLGPILLLASVLVCTSGCYYAHLAEGQARLLLARTDLESALEDPATPPELRAKLLLVKQARAFAPSVGLTPGNQYRSYAEWPGDRVVTTVVATRPGEIEPAGFRFPIVGSVPYKGFFELARAEREARSLRGRGLDVCLVPVAAYSTLGWFDDPMTTPMLQLDPDRLVETLLHELVHATVFVRSAARFNEGVASFVGQEATSRFFAERDPAAYPAVRERIQDDRRLAAVLARLRAAVASLYETPPGAERDARRAELERQAREEIAALPLRRSDPRRTAEDLQLGDACLALMGTYRDDLPRFASLLQALAGDLPAFVAAAKRAAGADDPLEALLATPARESPSRPEVSKW